MIISKFQKWLLKWICKKLVIQGPDHQNNIIEYYGIMFEASEDRFTEDNMPTLQGFLADCFFESTGRNLDVDPGFLESYYILKKILEKEELLPLLLGLSPKFDEKIHRRLTDGNKT